MKKNRILLLLLVCICSSLFSQVEIASFNNRLKTNSSYIKDIYAIVNKQDHSFTIFFADAKNVYTYNFNDLFSLKNEFIFENKRRKYKDIIGYSFLKNRDCKLYLKNEKNHFLEILFSSEYSIAKEFKPLTDYETYLQSINLNNKFYLITGSKEVNGLYIYTFDGDKPTRHKVNLENINLLSSSGGKKELVPILMKSLPLIKLDQDTPNSIEISSKQQKMYVQDETIIFTLNNNSEFTQIVKIDLKDFAASSFKIKSSQEKIKRHKKKSNSYLLNDKLISLTFSKEKLSFNITDVTNRKIIKEFSVLKTDTIKFRNSPITTDTNNYKKYNELKKTEKFFNTMRNANPAISALFSKGKYYITIGGSLGPVLKSYGGGSFGSSSTFTLPNGYSVSISNNIGTSFYHYTNSDESQFIKFSSILDENFSHLKDEKNMNAFEKINNHLDSKKSNSPFSNLSLVPFKGDKFNPINGIFKYKDFYILIDYNQKQNNFKLLKFTN
ncbi:hypothetical protein P8625_12595 [Tenacibaculum tangerinum]|uniref:Uncharacterized protein n=1 Tax=Tenacibaculum tangerinum TaxID=3038772 RepID=A0ABY8L0B0_9FLAO|nr:hypothetical protein [Tenacibaculum tangerinum]WGH74907.1 hypothetical protein P8625_12595 [Tenacibaculum tangerinum]